jgi:hypothetical protein
LAGRGSSGPIGRPLLQTHYLGSKERPDDSNDLEALDGGVMGEGGCPSRVEVITWGHWLSPINALTIQEYMGASCKSQENTLRNQIIVLLFHVIIAIKFFSACLQLHYALFDGASALIVTSKPILRTRIKEQGALQ